MKTLIALFRGINIGGHKLMPMKELTTLLESLGAREVRTYAQSGNAVFRTAAKDIGRFAERLEAEIGKRYGFEPCVLMLTPETLARFAAENPFPEAIADGAKLHLGFLAADPANPDLAKLAALRTGKERFQLNDGVLYLHLPDGAGISKLAAGAEKALGVPMTARNWKTVCKLLEMAEAPG